MGTQERITEGIKRKKNEIENKNLYKAVNKSE